MKKLVALSLCGVILISGLTPLNVEASASGDAMINKVIDKMMREKESGNSLYYDLVMGYKDYIDSSTLASLYGLLPEGDKAKVRAELGEGTTDADIIAELRGLSSSDIQNIKSKIDAVIPSTGGPTPIGGGGGGSIAIPPQEEKKPEEKPIEKPVEVEKAEEQKPQVKVSFKDIGSMWQEAQDAINFMAARGVLQGKSEGIFAPTDSITRAEFAKTIVALLELKNDTTKADKAFNDVVKSHWYYEYVQIAFKYGIIQGRDDKSFAPNDLITRQEMAVMIARTMRTMEKAEIMLPLQAREMLQNYSDYGQVANWAELDMALIVKNKIIQGKDGKYIAPNDKATRAEAVVILKRLFDLINK